MKFSIALLLLLSLYKCENKCYDIVDGKPVEIPCPNPSPTCPPPPECKLCERLEGISQDNGCLKYECVPEPCPSPTIIPPTPTPIPSPTSTIEPSPIPTPTIDPGPSPFPTDCNLYKPWPTGWSFLNCIDKNRNHICGGSKPDCTNSRKVGDACDGDSTPRYNGEVACWKTGNVERCEYPPGSKCGETTDWSASPGVLINPESDGYGARIKFVTAGTKNIKACRKNTNLCTDKQVKVQ